ncbi:MAG: hypothetical protein AAF333_02405 [Planctomycetota bacterium]
MPAPAALPVMPIPPAPAAPGNAAGNTPAGNAASGGSFADRLQGPEAPAFAHAEASPVAGVEKSAQVNQPNLIEQFDAIRTEAAEMRAHTQQQVAEGKLGADDKSVQLMQLFDLQTRAHDVAFRVELLTKVVEQGVKGVTQISATQA